VKKLAVALLVLLIFGCFVYGFIVINQQAETIKEHERLISRMQDELEYQNNVDYILRSNYADVQAQLDWDELYMWQQSTDKLSKAEFAAKVEDNPRRSKSLLTITKHTLPWAEE